jgi:hypothetical protein
MPTLRFPFPRLLAVLLPLLGAAPLPAVIVSYTLSGVTTTNFILAGALNTAMPEGSTWTAVVSWDTGASTMSSSGTQAQYRLSSMSFTLQGTGGTWTTGVNASDYAPSFTTNYQNGGAKDEIQFTSGWGPSNHTNATIYDYQPYSINLVLGDPTGTAIPSLTPAPTFLDLANWNTSTSHSYMKLYLNNDGNRWIMGSIQSISVTGATPVPEPSTCAVLAGAAALGLAAWRRRRARAAVRAS